MVAPRGIGAQIERSLTAASTCASVSALSPTLRLSPDAAITAVALVSVTSVGSAPAASSIFMISTSAAALASRNGVAPAASS